MTSMYTPRYHALTDLATMHSHIAQHPLGAWVCNADGQLVANHIPFVLDPHPGPHGRLLGHVSRANPVWRELVGGVPSVATFMGPQAYVTPSWYPGKKEHGRVVPTWNYVTVHVHGVARPMESRDWIRDMLERLTDAQEAGRPEPWRVADAPADYIEKMLRAVVGIEISIDRVEGRLKVSQDEHIADRLGTVEGLKQDGDSQSQALSDLVLREVTAEQTDGLRG